METVGSFAIGIFGILNFILLIVPWVLGIYALLLVIKALKIYIRKNS